MRRAAIYLRVSTLDQTTANQERELREIAGRTGCEVVKVYKDHGISGTRGRDRRPAFDKLCRDAALREFDMVMAWSVACIPPRPRAGPERPKSRRRKTVTQKRRGLRNPSAADHQTQYDVSQLTRERDEALEREKATAEVLRVISSSPGELEPVFQTMLENATRICEAVFGNLYLCDADAFRMVAAHHDSPAYIEARTRDPLLRPPPDAPLGRLAITKQVVQIADIRTLASHDHPFVAAGVKAGYRTVLAIPVPSENYIRT